MKPKASRTDCASAGSLAALAIKSTRKKAQQKQGSIAWIAPRVGHAKRASTLVESAELVLRNLKPNRGKGFAQNVGNEPATHSVSMLGMLFPNSSREGLHPSSTRLGMERAHLKKACPEKKMPALFFFLLLACKLLWAWHLINDQKKMPACP